MKKIQFLPIVLMITLINVLALTQLRMTTAGNCKDKHTFIPLGSLKEAQFSFPFLYVFYGASRLLIGKGLSLSLSGPISSKEDIVFRFIQGDFSNAGFVLIFHGILPLKALDHPFWKT